MSAGRVCEKHHEWCPTGECRWCEPVAAKQTPLEPLRFDEWTPGEPVTLGGVPYKSASGVVVIPQAALDAVGHMTLEQLLLRVNADEAKALRAMRLRLAETFSLAIWSLDGPVTLFPAEDVPVGAIRWEPSE